MPFFWNYTIIFKMWRYLIPNSLSLGNLTFGFIAILLASEKDLPAAEYGENIFISSLLILLASLLDGFDGITARALKVESRCGEYLDTLADMTTFGIAPAFIMYQIYLRNNELFDSWLLFPLGLLIASLYPMCAAFRLARFNANHDDKSFEGLPTPIAASLIVMTTVIAKMPPPVWMVGVIYFLVSLLMISNIKYTKPQSAVKYHLNIFRLVIFLSALFLLIFFYGWYWVVLFILLLYTFSGLLSITFQLMQKIPWGHRS